MEELKYFQIVNICRRNKNFKKYFAGCFHRDSLPEKQNRSPCCMIVNTDFSWNEGLHWILIMFTGRKGAGVEMFDPLGRSPHYYGEWLTNALKAMGEGVYTYSTICIQSNTSTSCGMYVCYAFHRFSKGENLEQIISRFSKVNLNGNDLLIRNIFQSLGKKIA